MRPTIVQTSVHMWTSGIVVFRMLGWVAFCWWYYPIAVHLGLVPR